MTNKNVIVTARLADLIAPEKTRQDMIDDPNLANRILTGKIENVAGLLGEIRIGWNDRSCTPDKVLEALKDEVRQGVLVSWMRPASAGRPIEIPR